MKKTASIILLFLFIISLCSCSQKEEKKQLETSKPAEAVSAEVKELKGIDVSSYSGEIDWEKVSADGVKFAMIRIGGRGYGDEGTLYTDDCAQTNLAEAKKNNIMVGAYFYSQAVSIQEAEEEAEFAADFLSGTMLDLPVAYDFEHIEDDTARTDDVTYDEINDFAEVFCGTISQRGFEAMVYGFAQDFENGLKTNYPVWLTDYENKSDVKYKMLQYSDEGKINGIDGSVDLDILID